MKYEMLGTNKCRKSVFMKFNIVKLLSIFTIIKLSMSSKVLKIALDWTPNTNHAGFYVGLAKGWFEEEGIDLRILSPSDDYSLNETPARRILKGEVDLCVAPTESVISCWTSEVNKTRPVAVAALLQQDSSAIVSLASGPVKILSDLGNHRYASYGGRFEMAIVKQMIAINGGNPSTLVDLQPPKLDCFDAVIRGEAEATWIFTAWEGIMAKYKGIDLNAFPLKASNIPYGYSPVLLAHPDMLVGDKSELLKKFLKVCQKSYEFCVSNPDEAAKLLFQQANHKSLYDLGLPFVTESQQYLSTVNQGYLDSQGRWGMMDPKRWTDFIDWLCDNQCLTNRDGEVIPRSAFEVEKLFTNDFLEQ